MNPLESLREKLGLTAAPEERCGTWWLDPGTMSARDLTALMNTLGARFITITAHQLPKDEGLRLEYHWDLNGQLLGASFTPHGNTIESIYDICEAADWIEREVHEEYALDFTGRVYEPLLLRTGDKAGVNLREEVR